MKKILIIHHSGYYGGAGISIANIATMLSDKYAITICCPKNPNEMYKGFVNMGFNVIAYDKSFGSLRFFQGGPSIFNRSFWMELIRITKSKKRIEEIIRNEKPDIVIINSLIMCWMGKIIKSFKTIKSVCFIRETVKNNLWGIYKKSINYYLNRFYDAVFFISEYDYKNHNCKAPVTGIIRNTHRIDNLAINQSQFEARKILKLPTDGFFILFFGGFDKLKGTHVIVKALSNLKNDNIHLINVGAKSNNSNISIKQQLKKLLNKDYEKSILNIVDKYKLENKIHYTGKYFDTTVLFNACDVLVFPSTSPHQARPVFEAGFFKKPVIISDFKETSEYVTHNYNGLVFKPNDPFGLSNCIQLLKTNQDFCIKLGLNNYIKSSENHDYKVILEIVKKSFML